MPRNILTVPVRKFGGAASVQEQDLLVRLTADSRNTAVVTLGQGVNIDFEGAGRGSYITSSCGGIADSLAADKTSGIAGSIRSNRRQSKMNRLRTMASPQAVQEA